MPIPTPVLVLAGLDETDLVVAAMHLQCDVPRSAVVQLAVDAATRKVRWTVSDVSGLVEQDQQDVDHPCISCSMRIAVLPTLVRLARTGRWDSLFVVLPVSADPLPVSLGIAQGQLDDGTPVSSWLDLRGVASVVSGDDTCAAVFDDPLLDELGLALTDDDRRSYGEAVVNQIELASAVLLTHEEVDDTDRALLDHLRRPDAVVGLGLSSLSGADLLQRGWDLEAAREFVDPRQRRATQSPDAAGIVTVTLDSWLPFHPQRLDARIEQLGCGDMRARGCFWLPGRPATALAWEAAGGQLSIGSVGPWGECERRTRLVVTTDSDTAAVVTRAFYEALTTEAEMLTARERWLGRPDGFEDWLGEEGASDVA